MKRACDQFKRGGFTLVELMVVVVVIGILAAIAVPKFTLVGVRSREQEAILALSQVYRLQETYRVQHGYFASTMSELSEVGWAPPQLKHFSIPHITGGGVGGSPYAVCMTAIDPDLNNQAVNSVGVWSTC